MKTYATQQRHRPMQLTRTTIAIIVAACFYVPTTNGFASWFVDRRVSCLTDLAANEIIMNNEVLSHSVSREPSIRLDVFPLGEDDNGEPNSEYVVKFIVPEDAKARVADVQYAVELGSGSKDSDPPAKFTTAPPNGGIGCEGWRGYARTGKEDSAAILTIDKDAVKGASLEITAGWATGHESVTLTEKVVVIVGQGVVGKKVVGNEGDNYTSGDAEDADDALQDDEAEAELEEAFIEEEREDLESEIESAEEDAVEALEEKRIETDGLGSAINEAEEEVVEVLEENRKHVNEALDSLKDGIMLTQAEKQKERRVKHQHNMAQRMEAQHKHREHHDRGPDEDKFEEMRRRFAKRHDPRKAKLDELIDMRGVLKDSVKMLKKTDKKEHDKARREHIKPLPEQELKLDMKELKQHAKERMKKISQKLGVNELMNEPHLRRIRGKLKKGLIRGSVYNGDKGKPLPPKGRHFLFVMFALFGLVGLIRWYLDKRRRAPKGRRNL